MTIRAVMCVLCDRARIMRERFGGAKFDDIQPGPRQDAAAMADR